VIRKTFGKRVNNGKMLWIDLNTDDDTILKILEILKDSKVKIKKRGISIYGAVIKKNKFLLIHRSRNTLFDVWEFPGGKLEFNESIKEGIAREVKEEVGLKVKIIKPLDVGMYYTRNEQHIVIVYLCKPISNKIKLEEEHFSEYQWMGYKEIVKIKNLALSIKCVLNALKRY
jgi:8-oxo-dGTP diphosphatase